MVVSKAFHIPFLGNLILSNARLMGYKVLFRVGGLHVTFTAKRPNRFW